MSSRNTGSDGLYGYGGYAQSGSEGHDSQYDYQRYPSPPERQPTMPIPENGGYGYPTHAHNHPAPHQPQSTSFSSPWTVSQAGDGWRPPPPHAQASGNLPPNDQWQGHYGRGLVAVPEEAPWMSQTSHSAHVLPPQNYPYPIPRPQHAATMPSQAFPQSELSSSPINDADFGGYPTTEYQPYVPPTTAAPGYVPQGHSYYPANTGMTADETFHPVYSPTSSEPPRSMTLNSVAAAARVAISNVQQTYFIPIEDGDPRAQQSALQNGGGPKPKPKPKPKPAQYTSEQCLPQHEMLPPSRRGTF